MFVQVVLGVIVIQGRQEPGGPRTTASTCSTASAAAFAVGIIYSYRSQLAEKKYLLYGCGGLFIMGLRALLGEAQRRADAAGSLRALSAGTRP